MSKTLLDLCHQLVLDIYTYTHKRCFFTSCLRQNWSRLTLTITLRLTLLMLTGLVSSDGASVLMDRMFSVYICIPRCLYALLTARGELTRHTAARLSLRWIRVSGDNKDGGHTPIIIHLYATDLHTVSMNVCFPVISGNGNQSIFLCIWWVLKYPSDALETSLDLDTVARADVWVWLCSRSLGKLLRPGSYCGAGFPLHVAGSSIWTPHWPIKCLRGLVKNLLAVSRWGVLGWAWLWSVTEVTFKQAEEREIIDGKSLVVSQKHRQNNSQAYIPITFPCIQKDYNTHARTALTLHTYLPLCVAWISYVLYAYGVKLGKWLLAHCLQKGSCFFFITPPPPLNKPPERLETYDVPLPLRK